MTFQERFTEACKTQKFKPYELIQGPDAGYTVWEVQHVSGGQQVTVDGPFFTEEEATGMVTTSAPRRLAAISKEELVRVEFSKNRFITVRPRMMSSDFED